jgi:hypothetical protein
MFGQVSLYVYARLVAVVTAQPTGVFLGIS